MSLIEIFSSIKKGIRVSDTQFNKIYPQHIRKLGERHWTEVQVALDACTFLTQENAQKLPIKILDVGSGVGKFCTIGALHTSASFTGIERRRELYDVAKSIAKEHKIERTRYILGDMSTLDWNLFTGAYLFNPFCENMDSSAKIDDSVECGPQVLERYVACVEHKLKLVPPGFRLATYYGFGGNIPNSFEQIFPPTQTNQQLQFFVQQP